MSTITGIVPFAAASSARQLEGAAPLVAHVEHLAAAKEAVGSYVGKQNLFTDSAHGELSAVTTRPGALPIPLSLDRIGDNGLSEAAKTNDAAMAAELTERFRSGELKHVVATLKGADGVNQLGYVKFVDAVPVADTWRGETTVKTARLSEKGIPFYPKHAQHLDLTDDNYFPRGVQGLRVGWSTSDSTVTGLWGPEGHIPLS